MNLSPLLRYSIFGSLLLMQAACSTVGEHQAPELELNVPVQWSQGELSDFNWGKELNAPQLEELIRQALAHNANLQETALRWQASTKQLEIATGKRVPELSAGFSGRRQESGKGASDSFSADLSLSWELDVWRKLADSEASSYFQARQQTQLYRWARISLASSVATNWLSAIELKQQWLLAQARESSLKSSYEVIFDGFKAGTKKALDVYSAKTAWQNGQTNTQQKQQLLNQKLRELAVLIGKYPDLETQIPNQLPELSAALPENMSSDLLANRPDLLAASDAVAAQEHNLGVARKNRLPRFTLSASAGLSNSELSDLLSGDEVVWSLLGGITAPLFKGGQLKAEQERQALLYRASIASYKQTALKAFQEVENRLDADSLIQSQYQSAQLASRSAHLALLQAKESYSSGLLNVTSLLQTERTAFDRQSQVVNLNYDFLVNRIKLYLALGSDLTGNSSIEQINSQGGVK